MAETITKQLWSEFNGKGFEAESAKYAERASCDAMDNDLTLTITNSKVNAIGGCNLAAETAIKDSEGNLFNTTYAKKSEIPPSLPEPQTDNVLLAGTATGNKVWQPLAKDTFGSITDTDGEDIQDETGNAIVDDNSVELWASFNGTGFGAERALADADGNNIAETYAKKGEASSVTTSYDALTKTLTINI